MSKSSSIFMSVPNIVIYCMRQANSQESRSRWSKPGSSGWAGVDGVGSTSERERFRETISAEGRRKARRRVWRFPFLNFQVINCFPFFFDFF